MRRFARSAFFAILAGMTLLLPRAADEKPKVKLPAPKEVLERYAKEIGGKKAFEKHDSQHVTGSVSLQAQNLSGKMEVFAGRPNKMIMKVTLPGLGEVTTGYNGQVGWMSTAITGPILLEGKMIEEVATQADFDHALHDPADYKSMEMLGLEEFEGEECYKIQLLHRTGFESTEFFSKKTGLQRGFISTQQTPLGPVKGTTVVSEYRKFGDLYMPSKMTQKASGIETLMTILEMEFDKVDPAVFETPADVKTLLEKKKETEANAETPEPKKADAKKN